MKKITCWNGMSGYLAGSANKWLFNPKVNDLYEGTPYYVLEPIKLVKDEKGNLHVTYSEESRSYKAHQDDKFSVKGSEKATCRAIVKFTNIRLMTQEEVEKSYKDFGLESWKAVERLFDGWKGGKSTVADVEILAQGVGVLDTFLPEVTTKYKEANMADTLFKLVDVVDHLTGVCTAMNNRLLVVIEELNRVADHTLMIDQTVERLQIFEEIDEYEEGQKRADLIEQTKVKNAQ